MSYFSYVGKLFSNVKGFYNEINAATLTGAIDAIIIEQEDGTFRSSPFHVRFGKLGVLRSREKVVDIEINGESVDIQMKLGDSGEAFFVEQVEDESEDIPTDFATSPLAYDSDVMERGIKELHKQAEAAEVKVQITDDREGAEVKVTQSDEVKDTETDVTIAISDIIEGSSSEQIVEIKPQEQQLEVVKSDSTFKSEISSEKDTSADIRIESETNELLKNRRRRRRKKKNTPSSVRKSDPTSLHTGDIEDGDIFEMEDLSSDEEMSRLMAGMPKSVSLPAVEESKLDRTNEWATAHESFYLNPHPFSDTDLSPLGSPTTTRPHTPKSDTEVERQKSIESQDALHFGGGEEETTLWDWGDLPRKSVTDDTLADQVRLTTPEGITQEEKAAASGGLFQFMRKTKNVRHKPEEEGIYLDDLNIKDMDPEVAKLYFPKRFSNTHFRSIEEKEDDTESGRGASLPQSPHSVEGAIGGPSLTLLPSEIKHLGTYSLSLCGGLSDADSVTLEKFMSKIVTYDDLCENPNMLTNPELVVRIGNKYYNWLTAAPLILSQIAFQKSLPEKIVESLCSQHMPKKKEKKESYSWFSWRRKATEGTTATSTVPRVMSESDVAASKSGETSPHDSTLDSQPSQPTSATTSPQKIRPVDRLKGEDQSSSEADTDGSDRVGRGSHGKRKIKREIFKKSLRLSSDQVKQLKLQPGQNQVTYSVTTQFQGTKRCTSHVYLWKYNDKIIVSDIDGTITKSDVLGQILPIMGRDWSQSGVAQLYSSICRNGYKFLYLSARAIGQSKLTKDLLRNINQGDMTLPEGPLLLSPTSLISAFHREVIEKKPEEFKISCLKDIGALFPLSTIPFYAGFGNKVNDVYAYKAINIPITRIFTINPSGELKHELSYTFQSSYTKLTDVADHFFPPVHKLQQKQLSEYSQVEYWREPLPEISPVEAQEIIGGAKPLSAPEKQSS